MQCQACDLENAADEKFCRGCGFPLQPERVESPINGVVCPRCGSLNNAGSFFCYNCGKYFANSNNAPPEGEQKQPSPPPAAKVIMPNGSELTLSGAATFIERSDFYGMFPEERLMSISRQHVLITRDKGKYYIQDHGLNGHGSTNHTRLNGVDIHHKGKQLLKDGDSIELAHQPDLTLTFRLS